jgi:uncharacterized protein YdeI (YjbR/CyaY-like superfamily)
MKPVTPLAVKDRAAWRAWLERNHDKSQGVWLRVAKKHADGVHYEEAVEEAVCYGWIDSNVHRLDEDSYRQWFSPRKPTSAWSQSNKERVERLKKAGCMTEAGLTAIRAGKKSGSWDRLTGVDNLEVPPDLRAALAKNKQAGKNFEKLAPSHKKQYIFWIEEARRDETRKRRISETVRLAAEGKKSRVE